MRSLRTLVAGAFALPLLAGAQALAPAAPDPRAPMVVSTAWLASHLTDANLVLLQVGDLKEYEAKHIAGARFIALQDIATGVPAVKDANQLEMPNPDSLRAKLAALGVGDQSRIIVYVGHDRLAATTRVFMTLNWAGLGDRTSLLDGGMDSWIADGHAVTAAAPPAATTGALSPLNVKNFVVNAEFVKANIGKNGTSIIDGRATPFYEGTQSGNSMGTPHRAGHVASAKSVPFSSVWDETNHLRSPAELDAIFAKAGVGPKDTVIGYCHIGQQATAMLFAARATGHPILLYDGSFEDWSRRTELPVETVPPKRP